MSSTIALSTSLPSPFEFCVENSFLALECLALRRKLREVKGKREKSKQQFVEAQKHYQERIAGLLDFLHWLLESAQPIYLDAVKSQYEKHDMPSSHVIQIQAKLMEEMRNQELLDSYARVCKHHNDECIKALKLTKRNMIIGLGVQEDKIIALEKERVDLLTHKLIHFSKKTGKTANVANSRNNNTAIRS